MPDPAHQLQQIYLAGFEIQTFERYPRAVGIARGNILALLLPLPDGLQIIGMPGWKFGEELAVLTEKLGEPVFQWKSEIIPATPERLAELRSFAEDLINELAKTRTAVPTPQAEINQ